jgi:hypothetical protein
LTGFACPISIPALALLPCSESQKTATGHGFVDAGHEWTAGGTEDLHHCPQNSYGSVHKHAPEHLVKDAQRVGIKDVVSKLDGPAKLMASVESIVPKPDHQGE